LLLRRRLGAIISMPPLAVDRHRDAVIYAFQVNAKRTIQYRVGQVAKKALDLAAIEFKYSVLFHAGVSFA